MRLLREYQFLKKMVREYYKKVGKLVRCGGLIIIEFKLSVEGSRLKMEIPFMGEIIFQLIERI